MNFKVHSPVNLDHYRDQGHFVLSTCQRKLILGIDPVTTVNGVLDPVGLWGTRAYAYMLEVITGLNGVLKGETEIMSQFRQQVQKYKDHEHRKTSLLRILEKLGQDSKIVRSNFLTHIPIRGHAYCSKWIFKTHNIQAHEPVLILGTGALAKDLIHQLKKNHPLYVYGRNSQQLEELKAKYEVGLWHELQEAAPNFFPIIINTIPDKSALDSFLERKKSLLFINYAPITARPPFVEKAYHLEDLLHILEKTNSLSEQKIQGAYDAIEELAEKRQVYFTRTHRSCVNSFCLETASL